MLFGNYEIELVEGLDGLVGIGPLIERIGIGNPQEPVISRVSARFALDEGICEPEDVDNPVSPYVVSAIGELAFRVGNGVIHLVRRDLGTRTHPA
ncbi:hypothetical protein ES703_104328 [subsurface metagenome]